jgi:hypothetical protein
VAGLLKYNLQAKFCKNHSEFLKLLGAGMDITVENDFPFRKQIQQVPGVRQPECKADHPHSSSIKVKNT